MWYLSVPTVSIDDGVNDSNKLREIIESEVFSEVFKQKKYPEMTFDEDMCVICNDIRTDNPALEFVIFMPCRHSTVELFGKKRQLTQKNILEASKCLQMLQNRFLLGQVFFKKIIRLKKVDFLPKSWFFGQN